MVIMLKLTSKDIYKMLIDRDKILEQVGQIRFYLGNIDTLNKRIEFYRRMLLAILYKNG